MKTLTAGMTAAIAAQHTGEEPLVALTITHASLAAPIRIIDAAADVVKSGNTYSWWPFRITLPSETKDELPSVTLEIDAVDVQIGEKIRALSGAAPSIVFEVVLASSPNTTESGPFYFDLRSIGGDAGVIRAQLAVPAILDEPAFAQMTPDKYPGLYEV